MRTSLKTVNTLEWKVERDPIQYLNALKGMENRVKSIQNKEGPECAWLLEHPPLYTLGTSGHDKDILATAKLPIFRSGRGGQVTYHGPGQRIIYLMLDLKKRKQDIRWYVFELEEWIIQILSSFGVKGERRPGRIGIWVQKDGQDHKIAALGVRLQKWVTSHGIALNVNPDLSAYQDIIPCGLNQYGITSLADLGYTVTLQAVDNVSRETFPF
jgi:lipoyl(octanoyl) transferase